MSDSSDQALVGTDAIKAFLENFDADNDIIKRIIVEELLKCLLGEKENA